MQEGKRYSYLLKSPQKLFHIFTNCLQHLKYANRQLIVAMPEKKSKLKYIALGFSLAVSYRNQFPIIKPKIDLNAFYCTKY